VPILQLVPAGMVIGVLVLCLSGIVGTWIVRGQLATDLAGIVTAPKTRATTVKRGLDRLLSVSGAKMGSKGNQHMPSSPVWDLSASVV
jgi:hypothetical protein